MAGKNTITRSVAPKSVFEDASSVIDATVNYLQGDLIIFDDTADLLALPAAETDGDTFLGVAVETLVDGKFASPYQGTAVDGAQAVAPVVGPMYGVIAKCVLATGSTVAAGDLMYLDPATGSRGVVNTGTKPIGVYQGPAIATSVAGQEVEVLIGSRFPGDSLKF